MPRDLPLERYRNIGIMAHVDAGKTTVTERILFYTGRIARMGEVHDGTTTTDSSPLERKMGITIQAAATTAYWATTRGPFAGAKHRINLVDTPGHVDFAVEVERSLRVLDGAVAVFDAEAGVEPQSEAVWRQADRYGVPRVAFVNKMDKAGADFARCLASIRARLGANAVAVQLPLGEEETFRGVVDLLARRAYVFDDATCGRRFDETDVPGEMRDAVARARAALVEACAEVDEGVLARFVESGPDAVEGDLLARALRRGTVTHKLVPVLCGAAYRNKGVQMLLDAIIEYLPSPADVPPVRGEHPDTGEAVTRDARDDAPACALAFKVTTDRFVGGLTWLRVYSGVIEAGASLRNPSRGRDERVGRLLRMHADAREDVAEARAGEIVAAVGLRDARTGDTLCDPGAPVALESMTFPEPVVELALEPKTTVDGDRMGAGLAKLALEDPTLRVATDPESGRTLVRGMGELHLEVVLDRLRRDFGVEARSGLPAVAYREALAGVAEAEYRHVKQSGGAGQYARVVLAVGPAKAGAGLVFTDETRGGVVPREFVPAIAKGISDAMKRGILAGYPMLDVTARLLDGDAHSKDSNAIAFETAGSLAFQAAARRAGVVLLEPVMALEVTTPEASLGAVLGDLAARRGSVRQLAARGEARVVDAAAPLAELFGYVNALRSRTQGRAFASMRFSHHQPVPAAIADAIVARTA